MVRIVCPDGGVYHEPPYTWEEEQAFYRAMGNGPVTVLHRKAEKEPVKESSPPAPAE